MAKKKTPSVTAILVECAISAGRGTGSKVVATAAAAFWADTYTRSIRSALRKGAVWSRDRRTVLKRAARLGRLASRHAGPRGTIGLADARYASDRIRIHPSTVGPTKYCP